MLVKKEEHNIALAKRRLPVMIEVYEKKAKTEHDNKQLKILKDYYEQVLKSERVIIKMIKEFDKLVA